MTLQIINSNQYKSLIQQILKSETFAKEISRIAHNFPNVKQEYLIRNLLIILLNEELAKQTDSIRVFADHPRRGNQYDMSIVDKNLVTSSPKQSCYKVDFKYQFSNDFRTRKTLHAFFDECFIKRDTELFIYILAHKEIEKKQKFDKDWGITSNLGHYICRSSDWLDLMNDAVATHPQIIRNEPISLYINEHYTKEYHFFLMERRK